jgi:UDP-N-acetylmuramoyl-tripeptide--D-alanyl-D-alanine ligase
MDALPLSTIAEMCGGTLVGNGDAMISRISKDTRDIQPGDLYLALRGENFDGNKFVDTAADKGAAAAIVDTGVKAEIPLIRVANSLAALHRLAAAWRDRLDLRVVGITGSSGKTSTKEFTAAVLSARYRVNKTQGNLNNHIGVPLTILSASLADQAAVWEAGMNHPGEIAPLAALARPDVAIITNIGVGHIEFFENRDGIAEEKAELIRAVHVEGAVILPAEDDYAAFLAERARERRIIRCGLGAADGNNKADVRADAISIDEHGTSFVVHVFGDSAAARIPVTGEHMVRNALLAIAAGIEFGLSLDECVAGLATARLTGARLEQKTIRGVRFLDDTYNANPNSMEAALKTLAALPAAGRRIAVLGRMGELGAYATAGYERVGRAAAQSAGILIAVGPETAPLRDAARSAGLTDLHEVPEPREAARMLRDLAREGDVVLVKGSRSARMEQVIGEF